MKAKFAFPVGKGSTKGGKRVTFYMMFFFFLLMNCIRPFMLPEDFEVKIYLWVNLMPSPIQYARKIRGYIELKGSFEKEPELKKILLLYNNKEIEIPFKKEKEMWLIEISPDIISETKEKEYLKFKLLLFYKGKIFEIIKEKIEIKRIY